MLKSRVILNAILAFLTLALNFGLRIYLAHNFSKQSLTFFYSIIDAVSLTSCIFLGLKDGLIRTVDMQSRVNIVHTFLSLSLSLIAFSSFTIIPICWYYLSTKWTEQGISAILVILMFLCQVSAMLCTHLLLAKKAYIVISVANFVNRVLFVVMFLAVYYTISFAHESAYLFTAYILSYLIFIGWLLKHSYHYLTGISLVDILPWRALKARGTAITHFLKSTTIATVEYSAATLYLYLTSFIILENYSTDLLAEYQVVARPLYLAMVTVFSYPIFRFLFPEISALVNLKKYGQIVALKKSFLKYFFFFSITMIVGVVLFTKPFIELIFPPQYSDAHQMTVLLLIGIPFIVYTSFSFSIIKGAGGFWPTLKIRLLGMISYFGIFFTVNVYNHHPLSIIIAILSSNILMFIFALMKETQIIRNYQTLAV